MKKLLLLLTTILAGTSAVLAQVAKERVVLVQAEAEAQNPQIKLYWNAMNGTVKHQVYRKTPQTWTYTLIKELGPNDTVFTDTSIEKNVVYEYLISREISNTHLYGTIACGIEIDMVHYRGEVFIAVDSALNASIPDELNKFYISLVGDGWRVHPVVTESGWTASQLKDTIKAWHLLNPGRHKTLLLLGDIPVPYSGNLNPDAHPDHKGAWPSDVYYGEFKSNWTDANNYPGASRPENVNIPGDGKFDQTTIPNEVSLQIGRVYLDKLSTFGLGRDSLYKRYLAKDYSYRMNEWDVPRRGLVDDLLNALGGEYPGRNGFQNANALFGESGNITSYDTFIKILRTEPYLFSHASSTGGYTSNKQLNSSMFKTATYSVFQTSFGSYHGDWDINNNLLRAEIAGPGYGLTSVWAGRPQWHFHMMAMGYPIGYSAWMTQNNFINGNYQTYDPGYGAGWVHVALMGDPTLRLHVMKPAANLTASASAAGDQVTLNWNASTDAGIMGYMVYRSDDQFGIWNPVTSSPVTGNQFTDLHPLKGKNIYMVRAVRLEEAPGGSYYNMSQGVFSEINAPNGDGQIQSLPVLENETFQVYPNPSSGIIHVKFSDAEIKTLRILDIHGKLLSKITLRSGEEIDLSTFAPGMYLLQSNNHTETLIITH